MKEKQDPCQCESHNQNHHHQHQNDLSKKDFHVRKTFFIKLFFLIFYISFGLIMLIVIVNAIFMVLKINIPRIFFPGFLLYVGTIICAGGILGSYGPVNTSEPQLMKMRRCTSIIMLLMCLICSPIFLYQNIYLYSSVKDSKLYCDENHGKSKANTINQLISQKEQTFSLKSNYEYKYNNGLTCLEDRKCLRSNTDFKQFVCNYNYEEIFQGGKCTKIFETDKIATSFDNPNISKFASSCRELKKSIKPDLELYKCVSEINLLKEDSISIEEQEMLEKKYKKKIENYNQKIEEISKKLEYYDEDLYSYDEECNSNIVFNTYLVIIVVHILIHLFVSFVWIVLAINTIMKFFGLMEDDELKYYQEKLKQMNKIYQENQQKKNNIENIKNEFDESSPINIK